MTKGQSPNAFRLGDLFARMDLASLGVMPVQVIAGGDRLLQGAERDAFVARWRAITGVPDLWSLGCRCTLQEHPPALLKAMADDTEPYTFNRLDCPLHQTPSPYDQERVWPIAGLNDDPADWTAECLVRCPWGCGGRPPPGCGGCCECLGGCQAEYERAEAAPYVWEGDQS